ncbi:MAG: ABC transporter permease, partial [Spirosomaceae bacterium]|nr:ABC transporter permease [Spirosomataceae bacterium]
GLAIGIASAILLFSIVNYELSFDSFHKKSDRIYRIVRKATTPDGNTDFTAGNPLAFQAALKQDIPQFEKIVATHGTIEPQITILGKDPNNNSTSTSKYIEEDQGMCAGPEFFEVFDYKWLIGTPKVLAEPNVVVLTKKYAEKYFGKYEDAIGQYMRINNTTTIKVAGVLEDIPLNTDLPINLLFSYETKRKDPKNWGFGDFTDWGSTSSMDNLFVLLPTNFSVAKANELLNTFTLKHYNKRDDNDKKEHFLSPITEMHYDARFGNYTDKTISKSKIWGIVAVGFLIVLMACINFINIATAVASKRAKEVGVRKTLGSYKSQLIAQFMTETVVLVLISVVFGIILSQLGIPLLNSLFDFPTEAKVFSSPILWFFIAALFIIISLFSGSYPALVLSSFSPLEAFRQKAKANWTKGISLRQGLIVFQFSIALMLVIGTIVNFRQMDYINKMDIGFKKEGIFNFGLDTEYKSRNLAFREKLLQIPEVEAVSFSSDKPSSDNNWNSNFAYDNSPKDADFNISLKFADANFFKTYDLKLVAGQAYSIADTSKKFVVNETLLRKLGVKNPESAIGKLVKLGGWDWQPITGVVKDFHVGSAKDEIAPIMICDLPRFYWNGSVKISSQNLSATVAKIEKVFNESYPEVVFNGTFYEDKLQEYYKTENQLGLLYRIASGLAILIACLGLVGLVTFVAEQRTKEIGIRKVMGASIGNITMLISKDFIKLVFISMLIAFPIAYYFMQQWLQDFKFRVNIEWWYFALAGGFAILIALLSVSYQSIKAALMNPVKSLKSE